MLLVNCYMAQITKLQINLPSHFQCLSKPAVDQLKELNQVIFGFIEAIFNLS